MIRKRVEKCACGSGKTAGTCCLEEDAGMSDWKRLVLPAIDNLLKIANRTRLGNQHYFLIAIQTQHSSFFVFT
jgi:hypothetical protein